MKTTGTDPTLNFNFTKKGFRTKLLFSLFRWKFSPVFLLSHEPSTFFILNGALRTPSTLVDGKVYSVETLIKFYHLSLVG
jgi:hypothetical protein